MQGRAPSSSLAATYNYSYAKAWPALVMVGIWRHESLRMRTE